MIQRDRRFDITAADTVDRHINKGRAFSDGVRGRSELKRARLLCVVAVDVNFDLRLCAECRTVCWIAQSHDKRFATLEPCVVEQRNRDRF